MVVKCLSKINIFGKLLISVVVNWVFLNKNDNYYIHNIIS